MIGGKAIFSLAFDGKLLFDTKMLHISINFALKGIQAAKLLPKSIIFGKKSFKSALTRQNDGFSQYFAGLIRIPARNDGFSQHFSPRGFEFVRK